MESDASRRFIQIDIPKILKQAVGVALKFGSKLSVHYRIPRVYAKLLKINNPAMGGVVLNGK